MTMASIGDRCARDRLANASVMRWVLPWGESFGGSARSVSMTRRLNNSSLDAPVAFVASLATRFKAGPARAVGLLGALLIAALLMGCGSNMVPFSHELRRQNQLTDDDVRQLQFYVSHEVRLRRDATRTGRHIEGGRLKMLRGKQVEEVVVRDATPGIALNVSADAIEVSFQRGSSLLFRLHGDDWPLVTQPLRKEKARFATSPDPFPEVTKRAPEPEIAGFGSYFLKTSGDRQVAFQGKLWEAVSESFNAHLMIDAEALEEVVETHDVLEGRKLGTHNKAIPLVMF